MRLVGLKTASVDVSVAWMRKAMTNNTAAAKASIWLLQLMSGEPQAIPVTAPVLDECPAQR